MIRLCAVWVALALLASCGSENTPPPFTPPDGGRDASDSGGDPDASDSDGDVEAGPDSDAGIPDTCVVAAVEPIDDPNGSQLALRMAATSNGMLLGWTQLRGGMQNAYTMLVSPTGTLGTERSHLTMAETIGDPAVASTGAASLFGFRRPYGVMPNLQPELAMVALDGNGVNVAGVVVRATDTSEHERRLVLLGLASGDYLGLFERDGVTTSAVFDATGAIDAGPTTLASVASTTTRELARSGGTIFTAYKPDDGSVAIARLTSSGALSGTAQTIAPAGEVTEVVDVALASETAGIVVWDTTLAGTKTEVHYRAFNDSGTPIGPERVLQAEVGQEGRAPSVAAFAGGYVIAYRGTEDGATWDVRVALVDQNGLLLLDTAASALTAELGRVIVRTSVDGDVYVAWTDVRPATPMNGFRVRGGALDCE